MKKEVKSRRAAALATPTDLGANATKELTGGLNILLADVFALYLKTKNFHWHVSGPHFRDYHLLLDDQATQIDAMTDTIAERVRKLREDNQTLTKHMRILHELCDEHNDIATASLIENWIDETEQRSWFLFETGRRTEG